MSRLSSIQSKIATKIFSGLGSDATLEVFTSTVIDKWGDGTPTYATGTTVKVVPYNLVFNSLSYEPFGDLQSGDTDMILSYDTSFSKNDRITFDGVPYIIAEMEKFPFEGGNLAFAVRLSKTI